MDPMIRRIVDRCHVAESNLAVVRYVLSRFKHGAFWSLTRADRRTVIASAIARHAENRALYVAVMGGRL